MTVVELSECFPSKLKPVTGEFILQHLNALSELCNVVILVPVRFVPPKEIFTLNLFKLFSNLMDWFYSVSDTKDYTKGNLKVIYFGYVSLPRPFFEKSDVGFINFFYFRKVVKLLNNVSPDVIYCNWLRPWSELSKKLADNFKIPLIIDHHEDVPTLKKLFPENFKTFLRSFKNADRIIVHSNVNKSELIQEDLDQNLNLKEISINYLGQNLTVIKKEKQFSDQRNKLICVSHLYERRKNIDVLIKAFTELNKLKNFQLTIAGEGNLKKEYIKLTDDLNLNDSIIFAGSKSQTELEVLLEESDIFVLPSFPEAFGVVLIEALAKGIPVITCEGNGGGEELKQLGYPVILVKPMSAEELADAILKLSNDKNQMEEMSVKGVEILEKYFTWKKNAVNTMELIKTTIKDYKNKN